MWEECQTLWATNWALSPHWKLIDMTAVARVLRCAALTLSQILITFDICHSAANFVETFDESAETVTFTAVSGWPADSMNETDALANDETSRVESGTVQSSARPETATAVAEISDRSVNFYATAADDSGIASPSDLDASIVILITRSTDFKTETQWTTDEAKPGWNLGHKIGLSMMQ